MPGNPPASHPAGTLATRFAPSPTGWLHLGHVAHALWTWDTARAMGARVVLRMEDHDRGRCRPEYERQVYEDLGWLGLEPEPESLASLLAGPSPWRQSDCGPVYQAALDRLARQGLVYGCDCTRSKLSAQADAGAPDGREVRYPGTCRGRGLAPGPGVGARIRLPETEETFDDLGRGPQRQRPHHQCGDLLARDRNGNWTYQFAVTVDDLRHGITLVVRGEDLLESTGRQILLARLLGRGEPPRFLHHPVLRNAAGVKLSKQDRATGLRALREAGLTSSEVVGEALRRVERGA